MPRFVSLPFLILLHNIVSSSTSACEAFLLLQHTMTYQFWWLKLPADGLICGGGGDGISRGRGVQQRQMLSLSTARHAAAGKTEEARVNDEFDDGNDDDDDDDNDETDIDVDSVSEAEAVLACHAYLQRRNRLGQWTKSDVRKTQAQRAFFSFQQRNRQEHQRQQVRSVDAAGFFWENPSQLKYLRHHPSSKIEYQQRQEQNDTSSEGSTTAAVVFDADDEEDIAGSFLEPELDADSDDATMMEQVEDEIWETLNPTSALQREELYREAEAMYDEESTGRPLFEFDAPSESRVRRSEAAKKTWSDPEWKKRWYEKRWGGRIGNSVRKERTAERRRRRQIEDRLRAINPGAFLANDAVASMSEEEIAGAIRSYVQSRNRRSAARKKSLLERTSKLAQHQQKQPEETISYKLSRDALLRSDPQAMEEARRLRSERARKAYEKRLERQNQRSSGTGAASKLATDAGASKSKTRRRKLARMKASSDSPAGAMARIEVSLEEGGGTTLPEIEDVECMLKPARLSGRKDVLRRILSDCFGLRGKCVPVNIDDDDGTSSSSSPVIFVTQTPIDHLGAFCISKLRERRDDGNTGG